MAASRGEKLGTVFTRIQGLLRTGAIREADKPVWYDVFAAFPPRIEPKYDRFVPDRAPINILYQEDVIRAKFYNTFGSPDAVDMTKEAEPSLSQRFIDKYRTLESETKERDAGQLFRSVVDSLKAEGVVLRSVEEIAKEKAALKKAASDVKSTIAPPTTQGHRIVNSLFDEEERDVDNTDDPRFNS